MRLSGRIYTIGALAILAAVSFFLSGKPYYNWDMFPYMAVIMDRPGVPFDSTINRVYREAQSRMPAGDYAAMAGKHSEFRNDPHEFKQILRYYTIKPGYLVSVRFFRFLGFDLVRATYLPSVVSYFLIGLLLLWWLPRLLTPPYGQVIALLTCAIPFMVDTARYSSPDMLSAFAFLAGLCLLVQASLIGGLVVSGLSVVVRPDMIILYLLVILSLYLAKKVNSRAAAVFGTCGILIAYLIVGFPGILGEFLFIQPSYSPQWQADQLLPHYLSGLANGLGSIARSHGVVFLLLGGVALFLRKRNEQNVRSDFWSWMIISCWIAFIVRYLLHPVIEDRFMLTSYLINVIAFCDTIYQRRASLSIT